MPARSPKTLPVHVLGYVGDGRVRLERRKTSRFIHARAFIQGKLVRTSTRTANLRDARKVAGAWWEDLRVRDRRGERLHVPTFAECAEKYLDARKRDADAKTLSQGQYRNLVQKEILLRPLLGSTPIDAVTEDVLHRLRESREQVKNRRGDAITQSTIKKDIIFIHSVLVHARDGLKVLATVPKMPS